jgi:S-adenosylmethionine:tRNA ribosyltransferase-isomerase
MKKSDFYFELPPELIANYPLENRSDSRLLVYERSTGNYTHRQFKDLAAHLRPNDLLVMNDSQVIPARFYGHKTSGGKVEFLVERVITDHLFLAHIKVSKSLKPDALVLLDRGWQVRIVNREKELYLCEVVQGVDAMLHDIGHVPLPPYIVRPDETSDLTRYQTVYARYKGSVAAPTAGLHFDEEVLKTLQLKGVNVGYVTLHVGAGTFQPVRVDEIQEHQMHSERFVVSEALCQTVLETKAKGGRVIAVGTTALRSLESAAIEKNILQACDRETSIFIYPGYQFKICDGLITNFHIPESTLLMLVSAFIGRDRALDLYRTAIAERYRFYSYGDVSLLL